MLYLYCLVGLSLIVSLITLILTLKAFRKQAIPDFQPLLDGFAKNLHRLEDSLKAEFSNSRLEATQAARSLREESGLQVRGFAETIARSMDSISQLQKQQLESFAGQLGRLTSSNEEKLEALRAAIESKLGQIGLILEKSLKSLQDDNAQKLEKMRETVDEKLQKTLETRLSQSFELVSKNLESVQKGLGEMQQLASGVGDLKRVLTNVKTRGILGEYQLEAILEQLLTVEQYSKNVKTKPGSNALVEFAIKLPGRDEKDQTVWLPVDSKFPKEDFELLTEAYEYGNLEAIEEYRKAFVKGIRKCAADICEKYVDPPHTTDFAILFLPFESLYAEVLRTPGLFEAIQRECKIIITGPTTLSALLSSLQMGFRTLAISKRSSEVWELLGAVKTEFGQFSGLLEKTNKKLQEASNVIDLASRRTRAIEKKLRGVQQLPADQATALLGEKLELLEEDNSGDE